MSMQINRSIAPLRAIPYYSWNNRTVGRMVTWLQEE